MPTSLAWLECWASIHRKEVPAVADNANPILPPAHKIGVADERLYAQGATFKPDYVERSPRMWAVGETDMKAIAGFQAEVTIYFSFGGFFTGTVVNIVLTSSSSTPLSEIGNFLLYRATWFLGALAVACFVAGFVANNRKTSLWEQIKSETKPKVTLDITQATPPVPHT
jgi:hypothetical protein